MLYDREIVRRLQELALYFPAVVVTGARQSGKTTALQMAFPSHNYVSLDLPSEAERAENDPQLFLSEHPPPLLVDEVQYAPKLFRHLKIEIDRLRDRHGRFVLSGSQKFPLMKEVSDSLAGRVGLVELETLSAEEIFAHPDLGDDHRRSERLVCRGGFPELWKQPDLPRDEFFRAYVATYIERDVRQLLNVSSLRDFERFIRLCAARNAQLLNKTELAKGVGVTLKTISDWLSVLVASNQICLLEPYMGNLGKRIVKSPKLYFCDTGLVAFLLGVDERTISRSPFRGALWESYVLAELRKHQSASEPSAAIWFYRDQQGREVDFIITKGAEATLIEAKTSATVQADDAKWMRQVATYFAQRSTPPFTVREMLVACATSQRYPISPERLVYAVDGVRIARELTAREGNALGESSNPSRLA